MKSMNKELDIAKKNLFVKRIQCELDDVNETTERYTYLKDIYDKVFMNSKKLDDVLLVANNSMFMKKWNRLPTFHKIQKVKEYIDEKHDGNEKLKTKLIQMVNDEKLSSCKFVKYDNNEQKITKIIISKNETY